MAVDGIQERIDQLYRYMVEDPNILTNERRKEKIRTLDVVKSHLKSLLPVEEEIIKRAYKKGAKEMGDAAYESLGWPNRVDENGMHDANQYFTETFKKLGDE
jgi:hypothetical protein